jgi:hypothetical protein
VNFRERDQIAQIIRNLYDADSKKGKNQFIGRLAKSNLPIALELEPKLTATERKKVAPSIKGYSEVGRLKREIAVRAVPE